MRPHQRAVATALGLLAVSVPFTHNNVQMELLVGEKARAARRHVAANMTIAKLSALRKPLPGSSENWELLQASLFAGGLRVCPTSGAPVNDVQNCSKELKEALWGGLVAITKAVNEKHATRDFDKAMDNLATLVKQVPLAAALRALEGVLAELTRSPSPNP